MLILFGLFFLLLLMGASIAKGWLREWTPFPYWPLPFLSWREIS